MDFTKNLVLENSRVRLRPLETSDFEALKVIAFDPNIWEFTLTRADDAVSLAAYLAQAVHDRQAGRRYAFAIVDRETGQLAGSTSYYNIFPVDQRLSIGYTWVGKDFQRTGLNRAAKHLLLCHAFGDLQCERVELETDSRNLKSQQAMRRMGATEEGTLRRHRITQGGYQRDTVIFSIIRPEWDELRQTVFKEYDPRS
ncbi:MAG: GNAT family N-acetyltransferase [Janthinobacterium lividum]